MSSIYYCVNRKRLERWNCLNSSPPPPLSLSLSLQIHPHDVPRHSKPPAEGEPAAFLLGYDVRVCRCQHVAVAGDFLRKRPSAGAAALHHDPEQQD